MGTTPFKGYGVVAPEKEEVLLEPPVLIKHGSRYGFKIKAKAPSIHMIKAGIETEIAPIVGDQAQAEELIISMNNRRCVKIGARNGKGAILLDGRTFVTFSSRFIFRLSCPWNG